MVLKPLSYLHLQPTNQLAKTSLVPPSLNTGMHRSLRELGPRADNENDIDVRAAAAMCQYAYYALNQGSKPRATLIDGWLPMTSTEVDNLISPGFHLKLKNNKSGFSSMLFQKQVDGIQYYAYCTEGTDMKSGKDWINNATQFFTGISPQYTYSVQMALKIDRMIRDKAILWFIGHSLGGGLASNNSLVTGRHAITFNAAGLHPWRETATVLLNNRSNLFRYKQRVQHIHAFVLEGEILNSFLHWFGQSAYGNRKVIKFDRDDISSTQRHAMTRILDTMGIWHD